jgi:hypothetical protein
MDDAREDFGDGDAGLGTGYPHSDNELRVLLAEFHRCFQTIDSVGKSVVFNNSGPSSQFNNVVDSLRPDLRSLCEVIGKLLESKN